MMHIVASWESASSVLSSVAFVAVAIYMMALIAFPYFGKRDEPHVENSNCVAEEKTVSAQTEDAISTDGGETSDSCGETSESENETSESENESDSECSSPKSSDNSSMWVATSFAPAVECPRPPPGLQKIEVVEAKIEVVKAKIEEPTYSVNLLLAARPRTPPGLKPVNSLGYTTEARPMIEVQSMADRASWGLVRSEAPEKKFSSYHKKQERLQLKQKQGKVESTTKKELAVRRVVRPAAPWKKQTNNTEWSH